MTRSNAVLSPAAANEALKTRGQSVYSTVMIAVEPGEVLGDDTGVPWYVVCADRGLSPEGNRLIEVQYIDGGRSIREILKPDLEVQVLYHALGEEV